eukprot:3091554-Rhodomonas_salina.1
MLELVQTSAAVQKHKQGYPDNRHGTLKAADVVQTRVQITGKETCWWPHSMRWSSRLVNRCPIPPPLSLSTVCRLVPLSLSQYRGRVVPFPTSVPHTPTSRVHGPGSRV